LQVASSKLQVASSQLPGNVKLSNLQ